MLGEKLDTEEVWYNKKAEVQIELELILLRVLREMVRDHVVISYGPPPTREQRNAYSNNARNRIAKNNRLRAQFQILKEI